MGDNMRGRARSDRDWARNERGSARPPLPIWPYKQPWKQLKNVHQQTALTAEPADQPAGDRQELKGWLRWAGLALASRHLPELGSLRDPC
jgi:hypothetical protein